MKSNVPRSMRRKVSNAIHAYYTSTGGLGFGIGGLCSAISILQGRTIDPDLVRGLQTLREEIMCVAVEGPFAYIPHAMLYTSKTEADAAGYLNDDAKERIRRTWLRHWTETGVILNHARWQALQAHRKSMKSLRAFLKKPALATESSVPNA